MRRCRSPAAPSTFLERPAPGPPTLITPVADTRHNPAADLTSDKPPSLVDAVGGPLGVAESALPAAAFVLTYTISGQDTRAAVIAAVALGVIFAVARIVRGQT